MLGKLLHISLFSFFLHTAASQVHTIIIEIVLFSPLIM